MDPMRGLAGAVTRLTEEEVVVLKNFDTKSRGSNLIGVQQLSDGRRVLVSVQKSDCTFWQKVLALFNLGKLGHISISPQAIARHLSQIHVDPLACQFRGVSALPDPYVQYCATLVQKSESLRHLMRSINIDTLSSEIRHAMNPNLTPIQLTYFVLEQPEPRGPWRKHASPQTLTAECSWDATQRTLTWTPFISALQELLSQQGASCKFFFAEAPYVEHGFFAPTAETPWRAVPTIIRDNQISYLYAQIGDTWIYFHHIQLPQGPASGETSLVD